MRSISEQEIETFARDGVVCLRGLVPRPWLERMQTPIARWLAGPDSVDLTAMGAAITSTGVSTAAPRFYAGTDHWRTDPDFFAFTSESPLPETAATLMRSENIWLYEDSVLVKEPGNTDTTVFHQDMAYFHIDGRQVCTIWCPLDHVMPETGALQFVRGSHLWERDYRPSLFVTDMPIPETQGDAVPDIFAALSEDPDSYDIVTFEMEPGDITVHHARTLHGASANASSERSRRAISVRYCGDDARYQIKPGTPRKPHHADVRDGEPLGSDDCPLVFSVADA